MPSRVNGDERGATAVIVALTLIALCGVIVLTVDVGQLLFKRRAMVNASDAAALSAAQSCAGLADSDSPEAMADAFAVDNVSVVNSGAANIIDSVGCDGPPFGHVTVQYEMQQGLFFAGVLGFDGPAAVRTKATAGWGPAGGANPLPIVVYTGNDQGSCDIEEDTPPGVGCYLWFDNDLFNGSSFGFLNLCTDTDPCTQGWDVDAGDNCPNVGASLRSDWINGNWTGGPNVVNYPAPTYVCRVSGLTSSNWSSLEQRIGDDLIFPVNDCTTQVDRNGNTVTCFPSQPPDKYNIIGFIVLRLDEVLDSKPEWEGNSGTCDFGPVNMTPSIGDFDLRHPARQRRVPGLRRARPPDPLGAGEQPVPVLHAQTRTTPSIRTRTSWTGSGTPATTSRSSGTGRRAVPAACRRTTRAASVSSSTRSRSSSAGARRARGRTSTFAPSSSATWRSGAARSSRAEKALKPAGGPADTRREL